MDPKISVLPTHSHFSDKNRLIPFAVMFHVFLANRLTMVESYLPPNAEAAGVQALGHSRPSVRSPPVGRAWTPAPRLDIAPEGRRSPGGEERVPGEVWGYGLETTKRRFMLTTGGEFWSVVLSLWQYLFLPDTF